MSKTQANLFEDVPPTYPGGLKYAAEFISASEEQALLAAIAGVVLKPYEFQSYLAKRQVAYFGWRYDYGARALEPASPIPDFLISVRDRAAEFAGIPANELRQAMVTEYAAGTGIGWHRDRPVFGEVIGISLLASCTLRFRRPVANGWDRITLHPKPRSIYLLEGPSRTEWYHSIPAVPAPRYSITFRRYTGN